MLAGARNQKQPKKQRVKLSEREASIPSHAVCELEEFEEQLSKNRSSSIACAPLNEVGKGDVADERGREGGGGEALLRLKTDRRTGQRDARSRFLRLRDTAGRAGNQ